MASNERAPEIVTDPFLNDDPMLELFGDDIHEECGVFGISAPGEDVARLTFFGLFALQHRGQESAGIATSNGQDVHVATHLGLVNQAFREEDLRNLAGGSMAIGHTRYSTTGSNKECNAGPMLAQSTCGDIAVSHNGNLVNASQLKEMLEAKGERFESTTDSEVLTRLIALSPGDTIVDKVKAAMPLMEGAYSLAILTDDRLLAVRDPLGVRPLCLGKLGDNWIVSSESAALMTVGAEYVREVEPGEIVEIDGTRITSHRAMQANSALCLLEFIYFARPDSIMTGQRLHLIRQRMGAELAREHPIDADVVVGLPDSATPAAIGYARESGIPYTEALVKNRYIGRTFIQPSQRLREIGVQLKFNALPEVLEGKRVVLVDDTIVRGTTSRPIVNLLKQAGAKEVHMRVHAPPIMWPCYLGVDLASRKELIAANMSVEEIGQHIGVDSIGYLTLPGLIHAIGAPNSGFCTGCLTGRYPVNVDLTQTKYALEEFALA